MESRTRRKGDCAQCNERNSIEDMVQCEACKKWYHYSCGGVDSSIADRGFECPVCAQLNQTVCERAVLEGELPKVPEKAKSKVSAGTSRASGKKLALELKQLEEQKEMEFRFLGERQKKEQEYIVKRYEMLALCDESSSVVSGRASLVGSRTALWVDQVRSNEALDDRKAESAFPVEKSSKQSAVGVTEHNLSSRQISARQVISKELPIFSGRPDDWPLFISSYENSTKICGLSNEENLWRLQRALKGSAFEAVKALLFLPSMVKEVISTLRMRFGRPEFIIHALLTKIRSEPAPKADRLDMLVNFALLVRNLYMTMEAAGLQSQMNNPILLQELVERLPSTVRLNWALHRGTSEMTLADFGGWLYKTAEAASSVMSFPYTESKWGIVRDESKVEKRQAGLHTHSEAHNSAKIMSSSRCFKCEASHKLLECQEFRALPVASRWEMVRDMSICEVCLGHRKRFKCRSKYKGSIHPLLRPEVPVQQRSCNTHRRDEAIDAAFRVIPVTLYGNGKSVDTFAFLDSGSSLTLVEQNIADSLGLNGTPKPLCLKWTADTTRYEQGSRVVPIEISGRGEGCQEDKKIYRLQDVRTVERLALPRQSVQANDVRHQYAHLKSVPLASFDRAKCGILLGINNQKLTLALKTKEGKWNDPVAIKTRLGWCLSGGAIKNQGIYHIFHACECDKNLEETLRQYYTLEDHGITSSCLDTTEEKRAKDIMEKTVHREGNAFVSGLLWRCENFVLPNSFPMALKRLQCLERKITKDPSLLATVDDQINNLVKKGYARKLNQQELKEEHSRVWYLPTFVVRNHNKPNKVRMVWDAAAKMQGVSLNDLLLKGPDEVRALVDVLFGFRLNRIGISGDIQEMFHQVRVQENDQHSQRFLWRDGNSSKEPDVYVMQVLTFGATCSPSIAQHVKNLNAREYTNQFPRAAEAIIEHHYVDDLLDSVDTIEEAVQLSKDVRYIHSKAGFNIRNWLSNSKEVLRALMEPDTPDCKMLGNLNDGTLTSSKVLGLWWNTRKDSLGFSLRYINMQEDVMKGLRMPTKRQLLKILMSVFDPLGFLSFFMVKLKVLLQEIWRSAIEWDELIPQYLNCKWEDWRRLLPKVEDVEIQRCYLPQGFGKEVSIQLHIFVDASEDAMAAVAYFRYQSRSSVDCTLVCAKSKVAPLKPLSIPKMELQAALIGSRLAKSIEKGHNIKIEKKFLWTDSRNVLSWLRADAKKFKPFVMFRVVEILDSTKSEEWRWVPTKLNVADEATKWAKLPTFDKNDRWFRGPDFLYEDEDRWPKKAVDEQRQTNELRAQFLLFTDVVIDGPLIDVHRFSKWKRLHRSTAWVVRARNIWAHQRNGPWFNSEMLTAEELQLAEVMIIQLAQKDRYGDELALLKNGKLLTKSSQLYKLSPYLDNHGVLRIRGRIDSAWYVKEDTRRPIILPRDHYVSVLIVRDYHDNFHHRCQETVVNEIRQRFWVPRLRTLVRSVRLGCKKCQMEKVIPVVPEMAPLPEARLAIYVRPFTFTGVDYFGPILVKNGRKTEKRWGVLFTCLTIRAIHLEMAHNLTSDSCIMCVRNFMSRRGTPREFYSDNGTNLKGAEKELREAFHQMNKDVIQRRFTSADTRWYFNPPAAPHMGGCWERLIGSVKGVLKEVTRNQRLEDESLRSLLIEVEGIINTRPLTHVSVEADDEEALTPNHFLIGSSSGSKPPGEFTDQDLHLRKNWRITQRLSNMFWRRWIQEYLPTLTRRTKWFKQVRNVTEGDVVILVDDNLPRGSWPKGIVVSTIMGKDGQIRRATVRTSSGVYDRPVAKLAVLDVSKSKEGEAATEAAASPRGRNVADETLDESI